MKFSIPIAWFLLLVLCIYSARADISLTLRNKQYLPPPIQELPINEEYLKTPQPEKFKENSYDNSRYQIFEIHNHYEASKAGVGNKQKSLDKQITFANNNYTPLRKNSAEKIPFQQTSINGPADFSLDDHNLDASYLGFATGNADNQQQIMQIVPFPSNFRHTFPERPKNAVPVSFSSMQQYRSQRHGGAIFRGPDYLPPKSQVQPYFSHSNIVEEKSRSQDHSSQQIVNNNHDTFKGPDYLPPNEQRSEYKRPINLSYHQQEVNRGQQSLSTNEGFKGPDYLPPQHQSYKNFERTSPFKGSDYERYYQSSLNQFQQNFISKPQFKGPDYLPPQTSFKAPDYLPPPFQGNIIKQQQNKQQFRPSEQFKGPEYLPPANSQEISLQRNTLFRGSDNLQPQHEAKQLNTPFKGPDYLPPPQSQTKTTFKAPDYLPPVRNQLQPRQQQDQNLPEGYDFKKPPNAQQAIEELHKLPEESPVSQINLAERDESSHDPAKQTEFHSNNGNLPAGYDFQKPENSEQAIKLLHSQDSNTTSSTQSIQGEQRSLPVYHFQRSSNAYNIENKLENLASSQQQFHPLANSLPTYDELKPLTGGQQNSYENNQQQITKNSQVYQTEEQQLASIQEMPAQTDQATNFVSQPEARQIIQSPLQPFRGPDYLPPSKSSGDFKGSEYLPATLGAQAFKGPDYLPPSSKEPLSFTSVTAAFKGPNYLPPASGSQNQKASNFSTTIELDNQFKGPDYLPPREHKTIVMYPLSSQLTNIKPNDRYGSRRPFPAYGLPPAETVTFSNSNEIAPMYRQPTPKPQYYAPTMSYANHAINIQTSNQYQTTSTLSQQAQQALQTFMPKEIRQTTATNHFQAPVAAAKTTTTLQISKPAKAKIRTVQIVNPNAIKTLKVLESLDDAGVKTIKILGSTNELPMGEHRVVKVVSGSNEQSVQTVKIFNDHQDVVTNGNAVSIVDKGSSYLPPKTKRSLTSGASV